ncbi:MAG: type II secretion system F family protein [Phycisphaerales bacterium]
MQIALQIIMSLVVFVGVALPIYTLFRFPVPAEPPVHRRFAASLGASRATLFENPLLAPIMNLGLALTQRLNLPGIRASIRQNLDATGNPSGYSVREYLAICLLSGAALGIASTLLVIVSGNTLALLIGPAMAALGFAIPMAALRDAGRRRCTRIGKQLPYTLDLISLTMAAGSTFTEAVQTLIRDQPDDDLNQELAIVLSEVNLGTPRAAAMAHMAERIPLESLRSIVGAVNQAESLGTPLSTILKLQSDMLRMHRGVQAEKLSASASLRILIPSMFILVAVVIIVFAPMIIRAIRGELF